MIFFVKNFKGISLIKFKPAIVLHVLHFIGDFFIKPALVLHVLHFIGDFFCKTRASLARAAFNQEGRGSIAGMAQVTSLPTPLFPHPQFHSLMDGVGLR